jgi:hypothetical protein
MLESGEETSHVTSTSAQENEDGVIVISDDDEEWSVGTEGYVI